MSIQGKFIRKWVILVFGIILLSSLVQSQTTVNETDIITSYGNFTNVTSSWFNGNLHCSKIQGADYNVCLGNTGNMTAGDGTFLYNDTTTMYFNYTYAQLYLNFSNARITWDSDSDLGGYRLTNVGELIISGLIYSNDIIPSTNNLYSLGNSTNWFKEIFVSDVYSENINATEINTTNLNSHRINTTNATIGGFEVYKDGGGDLNIDLN